MTLQSLPKAGTVMRSSVTTSRRGSWMSVPYMAVVFGPEPFSRGLIAVPLLVGPNLASLFHLEGPFLVPIF